MNQKFLLNIALLSSLCIAQNSFAFDEKDMREIVYSLFSYNTQYNKYAQQDIKGFADDLNTDVFGDDYWSYSTQTGTLKIFEESIEWVGRKAFIKAKSMINTKYLSYFSGYENAMKEQENVALSISQKMKENAQSFIKPRYDVVKFAQRNSKMNFEKIKYDCAGTLRTYVHDTLGQKVENEINKALSRQCAITYCDKKEFLVHFPCNHYMHRSCFKDWRKSQFERKCNVMCPLCLRVIEPYVESVMISPILHGFTITIDSSGNFSWSGSWSN